MNQLITYDEAAAVLRTPAFPKLARQDFTVVRALRKHLHAALAKLECPQSRVYGWTGLAMAPAMYAMIELTPFTIPNDPGPTPAYNPAVFQTPVQMKIADQLWDNDRRYYLLYENIHRACFRLLDQIVRPEFKVSNLLGLYGWNSTMTIQAILSQLETTFGRPSVTVLFQNNATFASPFSPMDTPESLFQRIEECQEIAVLGGAPYTDAQIVGTTMYSFMQSNIFPTKEFETWEAITPKTWPALKLQVQSACQRKLIATSFRNTSGQMGYAPNHNAFNAFVGDDKSSVDTIATGGGSRGNSTNGGQYVRQHVPGVGQWCYGRTNDGDSDPSSESASVVSARCTSHAANGSNVIPAGHTDPPECLPPPYPKFWDPDGSSVHRLPRRR
jgi:hypothetical protein